VRSPDQLSGQPLGPLDEPAEAEGPALETLFFQHLRAYSDSLALGYHIYYWRTSNAVEVDFVLYGERGLIAFEVKRGARFDDRMLKGLKSFRRDYPVARAYFIYGGLRRMYIEGIEIIPLGDALQGLPSLLAGSRNPP